MKTNEIITRIRQACDAIYEKYEGNLLIEEEDILAPFEDIINDYYEERIKSNVNYESKSPEKLYITNDKNRFSDKCHSASTEKYVDNDIEYIQTDVFIEKAKKWFEKQNEWRDMNGNRHCDLEDFEDFKKYMEGE